MFNRKLLTYVSSFIGGMFLYKNFYNLKLDIHSNLVDFHVREENGNFEVDVKSSEKNEPPSMDFDLKLPFGELDIRNMNGDYEVDFKTN